MLHKVFCPLSSRRCVLSIGLIGLALSTFLLAACVPASSTPSTPPSAPKSTAAPAAAAPAAPTAVQQAAPAAPTTAPAAGPAQAGSKIQVPILSSWWDEAGVKDFMNESKAAFEKANSGIEISPMRVPYEQMNDKIVTSIGSSSPPGLVFASADTLPNLVNSGNLAAYDQLFPEYKTVFAEPAATNLSFNGKLYAVPIQLAARALLYNKQMLADANIQAPTNPDELLSAAKKLTNKDKRIYGYGAMTTEPDGDILYIKLWLDVVGAGGNFAKDGKPTVNTPEVVQATQNWKALVDSGVSPMGVKQGTLREMFWNGQIAMINDGPWMMASIRNNNPKQFDNTGVALLPTKTHNSNLVVTGFAMPAKFQNPEAVVKYLKFISTPEWASRYSELTFNTSAMAQGLTPEILQKFPWLKTFDEQKKYAILTSPPGLREKYPIFAKVVSDALVKVANGTMQVQPALDEAQKRLQQELGQ